MNSVETLNVDMKKYSEILNEKLISKNFNLLDEEVIEISKKVDEIHNMILRKMVS